MTGHRNSMPVVIRGKHYPSQRAAAKALGISPSAISVMLSRSRSLTTIPKLTNTTINITIFEPQVAYDVECIDDLR